MISKIPTLTYLDDRPVFPDEHEVVRAWARDGLDGERAAREQIAERKKQRDIRNYEFMQAIRAEAFREVRSCRQQNLWSCTNCFGTYLKTALTYTNSLCRNVSDWGCHLVTQTHTWNSSAILSGMYLRTPQNCRKLARNWICT